MPSTELTLKGTTPRGPSSMPRTLEARSPELRPLSSYIHHRRTRAKQMRRSDNPTPRPQPTLDTYRSEAESRNLRNAEPRGGESVRWPEEMKTTRKLTRGMQPTSAEILYSLVRCLANAGSCDSNSTTSTIFASGTSSTNLPWKVSVSSEVLPASECSGF